MTTKSAIEDQPARMLLLHPITLSFQESSLEPRYKEATYPERVRSVRVFYLVGTLLMLGFGVLEARIFTGEVWLQVSWARYGFLMPMLIACAPLAFLRALEPLRRRYLDELILAVFVISLLPLFTVGPVVLKYGGETGLHVDSGAILLGMLLVFFVSHMRFIHASIVSTFCVVSALVSGHIWGSELTNMSLFLSAYPALGQAFCMLGAHELEKHRRHAFPDPTHRAGAAGGP